MKFTIKDKEFVITSAKTKHVLEIEKQTGKTLAKLAEDFSFKDVVIIFTKALQQCDPTITDEWVEENTAMSDIEVMNEVVSHFLAVKK
jgi:predicted kinase